MKNPTYLYVLLFALILSSCSSDDLDPNGVSLSDSIRYEDKSIAISAARIDNFGPRSGNYNYDFTLSGSLDGKTYNFFAELHAPILEGNAIFRSGTFPYIADPLEPIFHFNNASFTIDTQIINIKSGTITVFVNSDTNFEFATDITLKNGKTVSVHYDGQFTVINR